MSAQYGALNYTDRDTHTKITMPKRAPPGQTKAGKQNQKDVIVSDTSVTKDLDVAKIARPTSKAASIVAYMRPEHGSLIQDLSEELLAVLLEFCHVKDLGRMKRVGGSLSRLQVDNIARNFCRLLEQVRAARHEPSRPLLLFRE